MLKMTRQALKQDHDHIFISHGAFQASELIRVGCPHLLDVAQQFITFFHLDGKGLLMNEVDVGQALSFVDVAQCLPCFHKPLATLDVGKLVAHQIQPNHRHYLSSFSPNSASL
jgi:hypothetical protein